MEGKQSLSLVGSCTGPAGPSGGRGALSEARGDTEGGTGAEGEPGEGEGADETGAAEPDPGARGFAREAEEDGTAAPRHTGGG